MAHDGGGEEVLHHALGLQRLQPPDIQLPGRGGPQLPGRVVTDGYCRLLLLRRPLIILNQADLIGFCLHFQRAGLQLQRAVLTHGHHLRRLPDTGNLHQIALPDGTAGLGDGLLPGVPLGDGVLRLVQLPAQLRLGLVGVGGPLRSGLGLPHFRELREHLVRRGTGVPQDALGLRLAPAAGILLGPLHLLPEFPGLAGILLPLVIEAVGLLLPLFQSLAFGLQLGEHILKPDALTAHLDLGRLDDLVRQAQPFGDGEGVGLAGDADEQAVGGAEGLHIKFTGGVLHPRRGHGEGL